MTQIHLMTPTGARSVWDNAVDHLQPAIDNSDGQYRLSDLDKMVQEGRAALWVATDEGILLSAAITWVETYPTGQRLTLAYGGGVLEVGKDWLPIVEKYARDMGCVAVQIYGREGWKRELKDNGYRADRVLLTKQLDTDHEDHN